MISASVDFKGTLYLLLETDDTKLLIQIKDVPCIKTNPHSGLSLTPFKDYGFKQAMHIVRNKVSLQDNNGCKFDIPIIS